MRILLALLCFVAACAVPRASAADAQTSILETCLSGAEGDFDAGRACIGRVSDPCLNSEEGSVSTIDMITCFQTEREHWSELRGRFTQSLRAQESPVQIAPLDEMLAQHETWSQARCGYGASIFEGGSLARVVAAACTNRIEGELAVDLWLRLREYSER